MYKCVCVSDDGDRSVCVCVMMGGEEVCVHSINSLSVSHTHTRTRAVRVQCNNETVSHLMKFL